MTDEGLAERDGIEAKAIIVEQLARALEVIREHNPARIATLGGDRSVSVAPFSILADLYGGDLAIVWIDSHAMSAPATLSTPGYQAMAVSALTGHGDSDMQAVLPATVTPDRVDLVGRHCWTDDDYPHVAEWGLQYLAPMSCASRALHSWRGSPAPAAPGWPSTSMSTPSTATRLCSVSVPNTKA
jgi:arginase